MDSTDDEDHSNARWFYRRCSAARISMETPLSTLELSLRVLRFVESIVVDVDGEEEEEEEDDDCDDRASSSFQLRLFDELRDGCRARRRDLSFVYDVCDRALDLRDDGEFTEAALRAVAKEAGEAVARDGGGCIGLESREIGGGGRLPRAPTTTTTTIINVENNASTLTGCAASNFERGSSV